MIGYFVYFNSVCDGKPDYGFRTFYNQEDAEKFINGCIADGHNPSNFTVVKGQNLGIEVGRITRVEVCIMEE